MSPDLINPVVAAYERKQPAFNSFAKETKALISRLLSDADIRTSQIECRTKTIESLSKKLGRPDKSYSELASIPDLVGLRVIVYHPEDVDRAVALIKQEFDVDEESSGDVATRLAPHEFGYRSVHLVIRLLPNRGVLSEWRSFADLHAEVQIRTVLQHAWASISHSLQYKREEEVPSSLRRRLYRLSALLELADQEFTMLGSEHHQLTASQNPGGENKLMILRNALRNSAHSYEWIRDHTPLEHEDAEFAAIVAQYPEILESVNVIQHDNRGNRVIPGKPGIRLKRKSLLSPLGRTR